MGRGAHHVRSSSNPVHFPHASMAGPSSCARSDSVFIHPFQLTPRTSSPPLRSYAASLASFDNHPRDCSPTIVEDDGDGCARLGGRTAQLAPSFSSAAGAAVAAAAEDEAGIDDGGFLAGLPSVSSSAVFRSQSHNTLRRPSFHSRASSVSDGNRAGHMPKARPPPLGLGISGSRSDINLGMSLAPGSGASISFGDTTLAGSRSPQSPMPPQLSSALADHHAPMISPSSAAFSSPTGSISQLAPLRASLEVSGFSRLRNPPDISSAAHMEQMRNERRKFEEKESRKQERWDRKMIRKRDRELNRQAAKKEEAAAKARKNSVGSAGDLHGRRSSSFVPRPSPSPSAGFDAHDRARDRERKMHREKGGGREKACAGGGGGVGWTTGAATALEAPSASKTAGARESGVVDAEKTTAFPTFCRVYPPPEPTPFAPDDIGVPDDDYNNDVGEGDDVPGPASRRRTSSAKAMTHGAWTGFVLWLRTKLFKLGRAN